MSNQRFSSCGIRTTGESVQDQPVIYPCTEGLQGGVERTRFFDGMVLESSDLENEQAYWRTKRELTNRALGEGVVWGLRVEWDTRSQSFTLWPGYAIDCCGRDLVVSQCHRVSARVVADPRNGVIAGLLANLGRTETARAQLVLRAVEQPEEARLVCATRCQPGQQDRYEYTRMRETTQLCLVPEAPGPERGPVGDLIDDLKALRAGLSEEERAILFPDAMRVSIREKLDGVLGSQKVPEDAPPLYLIVRIGDEQRVFSPQYVSMSGAWHWGGIPVAMPAAAGGSEDGTPVHLELRAGLGWALHHGTVRLDPPDGNAGPGEVLAEVDAPLALELSWSVRIPSPSPGEPRNGRVVARAENLGLARLFSPRERLLIEALEVHLIYPADPLRPTDADAVPEQDGTVLYQVGVGGFAAADPDQVHADAAPAIEPDCFASLAPGGIFIGEPGKTPTDPRPPILAALYAWLARSLQGLDLESEEAPAWSGERLLASWIYVVAWRLFYGANAVAPDFSDRESGRSDLARLLHCLLQRWCHGFLYSGPRCTTEHQGVVLGTVELGTAGRVAGFDAWDGRRHVLTGPLIGHWLGQLGIAPPDIVAGRFVRAICCVAEAEAFIPAAMPISRLAQLVGQDERWKLDWSEFGPGAIAISGGAHLLIGDDENIAKRLKASGRSVLRREEVTAWAFVSRLVSAFGDAAASVPDTPLIQTVIAGQAGARLRLLVPAAEADLAKVRERVEKLRREVQRILERQRDSIGTVGPLGEPALEDFMTVLARNLALPTLKDGGASNLITALRKAGRPSLGDALALGSEGLLEVLATLMKVRPEPRALNGLWEGATERLNLVFKIVRKFIHDKYPPDSNPFMRDVLGESVFLEGLATALVLTSGGTTEILVTRADLDAAAAETIAMGP